MCRAALPPAGLLSLLLLLLLPLLGACRGEQLLANPSFEDEGDFHWQPFLSGFYVDRDCHDATHGKTCVSLTPAHFYGIWQGVKPGPETFSQSVKQFVLVAHANTEWLYDAKASVSVDVHFTDGTTSVHNTITFVNGILGFQRRCLVVTLPSNKRVQSATVFAVATPLSSSFGTVFFDQVELHEGDGSARCDGDDAVPRRPVAEDVPSYVVAKEGAEPAGWGGAHDGQPEDRVFRSSPGHRVCLVLALDLAEVEYAATLAEIWRPPIVAVVYVPNRAEAEAEYRRIDTTVAPFRNTKIVIVSSSAADAAGAPPLPVNMMRNLGEQACPAPRALHLEYGMIPSASLLAAALHTVFKANTVYVLPAFLVPSNTPQLADKTVLKGLVSKGERVLPYQVGRHSLSYWSTNYSKWMDATEPYPVSLLVSGARVVQEMGIRDAHAAMRPEESDALIFNRHYSPLMLVPTKHAPWDTRFTHRSHAKASYLVECFLRKTQFVVLADAFATITEASVVTPVSKSVELSNAYSLWRTYYSFLSEKMIALSTEPADASYLRVMPSADPDVDHRVEAPLARRLLIALGTICVAALILRHLLMLPAGGTALGSLALWNAPIRGAVKEL